MVASAVSPRSAKRSMNQRTFLSTLSNRARRGHGFKLVPSSPGLPLVIREKRSGADPVCAVAHELTGKYYGKVDDGSAAEAVGIDCDFADRVNDASDGNLATGRTAALRRRILQAVGLEDADQ